MKYNLKEMSLMEKPREKLYQFGAESLSVYELLAIILRTGSKELSVLDLSIKILKQIGSINALSNISMEELLNFKGIGKIKAIELLVSNGMNVNVAIIPEGKDADEYIFNNGSEALNKCLKNNIISGIEFLYNQEKKNLDLNNVNSIEEFKNKIFKYLNVFNLPINFFLSSLP